MGYFKLWIESIEYRPVRSVGEAKALSRASSLDAEGLDFRTIQKALAARREITYQEMFPLASLANVPAGDKEKTLEMMGAFAQTLGREPPDTLEQSQALAIRGPDFRKMTPPIIVYSDDSGIQVMDGVSRINAARLLKVSELRAFVIK